MERLLWIALALLTGGEIVLLEWFSAAARERWLALPEVIVAAAGLLVANFLGLLLARGSMRAGGIAQVLSRGWLLTSVGLLLTGGLLAATFLSLWTGLTLTAVVTGAALQPEVARALLVVIGGVVVATGFGASVWAATGGQRWVKIDRVTLPLTRPGASEAQSRAARALDHLRIVHLTDLHIGPLMPGEQVAGFAQRVNDLEPDLVVLTGDLFDFDSDYIEEGCRALAQIEARHGVFAVLGNHDVVTGADSVAAGLAEFSDIRLLRNEWVSLELDGGTLALAGVEDPGEGWRDRDCELEALEALAREIPSELPRLLLIHRPGYFAQAARLGFPLCLAGHTHGGQVSLPFLPHWNLGRVMAHWTRGTFEQETATLYVNRGLGVAGLPLRLNCPREIALLTLTTAP